MLGTCRAAPVRKGKDAAEEATHLHGRGRAAGFRRDGTRGLRSNPLLRQKALFFKLRVLAAKVDRKANNIL